MNARLVNSVKLQNAILSLEGEVSIPLAAQDVSWADSQVTRVYVLEALKENKPVPGEVDPILWTGIGAC